MSADLEERVWAYLDSELSAAEAARFERELLSPEVAQTFARVLLLREVFRSVGPDEVPADLLADVEAAVVREVASAHPEARRRMLSRTRAALGGLGWAIRGPSLALAGSFESTRDGLSEIGNTRYSLGPLADLGRRRQEAQAPPKKRVWWLRALRLGR